MSAAAFVRRHPSEVTTTVLLVLALVAAFLVPASRTLLVGDVFGPVATYIRSLFSAFGHFLGGLL